MTVPVLHLIDSLAVGGAERMAVNIANELPRDAFEVHLITTRREGPLTGELKPHVHYSCLNRANRFEFRAIRDLATYIRRHHIQLVHAHGSAVFVAAATTLLAPDPVLLWHVHYGRYATENRPALPFRALAHRLDGVVAVNMDLAAWACEKLGVLKDRIWYVPNFVVPPAVDSLPALPGVSGRRVVCLANLRSEKDQLTLIAAFYQVVQQEPLAHLLLVGNGLENEYGQRVAAEIERRGLGKNVSFLGRQEHVFSVLCQCDIGVLSSSSEGLPLALLEYGISGLPVVATSVGQCAEVLDQGHAGVLVAPQSPGALSAALLKLLQSPELAQDFGKVLRSRVEAEYGRDGVIQYLCAIYETLLGNTC